MKLCYGRADIGLSLLSSYGTCLCAAQRRQSYGLFDRHFMTLVGIRGRLLIVRAYEVFRGDGRSIPG